MSEITCPKCRSTQLSANKKGFSGKQAIGGAILTGGIGLLAGTIGSGKVVITCLACGFDFKPGFEAEQRKKQLAQKQANEAMTKPGFWIFAAIIVVFFIWLFN